MELSLIIPMYNATKYIDQCLTSIAQQNWLPQQFELLIIDDGSTDDSVAQVKKWQNKLPITLLIQTNQKQAAARNNGLNHATGEFILFVDIDDRLEPDMLKQLCQNMAGYDLVESGINKIFTDAAGQVFNQEIELPIIRQAQSQNELIKLYFGANTECDVGLWNKLFRREIIEQQQLRFSNGNFFEDSLFVGQYLNVIHYKKIKFVMQPLYNFYKRQGSTTTAFHQELDQLSESYLTKCIDLLKQTNLSQQEQINLMAALKLRVWIYTIHHHVKYDPTWSLRQQRQYLLQKAEIGSSFKPNVPIKYRLAFWLMLCFPASYNKMYCRKYL
ncbi:glycosyltransferase family 2 protein [Loigolactobacillus jiayinensis]|uniref:Glycosyltransferase family 2 protein n=1 Tax=Loigolactobacillus jiayinensis TaxID=2486016 RepID=A0ABW1RGA9_9LACO|nr:glycosyltransferase family 2 protein [Loigolactobacillus jiayinensis]